MGPRGTTQTWVPIHISTWTCARLENSPSPQSLSSSLKQAQCHVSCLVKVSKWGSSGRRASGFPTASEPLLSTGGSEAREVLTEQSVLIPFYLPSHLSAVLSSGLLLVWHYQTSKKMWPTSWMPLWHFFCFVPFRYLFHLLLYCVCVLHIHCRGRKTTNFESVFPSYLLMRFPRIDLRPPGFCSKHYPLRWLCGSSHPPWDVKKRN